MEGSSAIPEALDACSPDENTQDATSNKQRKLVRYSAEFRHPVTNELVSRRDVTDLNIKESNTTLDEPAFEVIATYKARVTSPGKHTEDLLSKPSYHINIYSVAITNALRSVVKYYPSQDLGSAVISVAWPYPILVHHYEELSEFKDACTAKEVNTMCVREKDAPEHIGLLLRFLDENVMPDVCAEQERNERGYYTWERMWVHLRPGTTQLFQNVGSTNFNTSVVHSVSGGTLVNPPKPWEITEWKMSFDGVELGRVSQIQYVLPFNGEHTLHGYSVKNSHLWNETDIIASEEKVREKYENGKRYWNLLQKQCKYYKGKAEEFPFNEVQGLVMVDPMAYYSEMHFNKPKIMDTGDLRNWTPDCTCPACKTGELANKKEAQILFGNYNALDLTDKPMPHHYLLFPHSTEAFVFATRSWESLHVKYFAEPEFSEKMIDNLVMDQQRKDTLMALSLSFARRNKQGEELSHVMWTADFVKEKGSGLIFLLHGRPGIGKTYTAECISAFTKRPLMTLTSSDIGTQADEVEENLSRHFRTAKSWGAVLLIDEADVFMERRTSSDLVRNSLVAGTFDDAFISRVHVQLLYEDFREEQRRQVWQTFVNKLDEERGTYIRLNAAAKEYIYSREVCSASWNGREIKNAFQTAVALAEYHSRKDEEGTILVTDAHFRPVIELSKDFRGYLKELHKGDESKRAERSYSRLDASLQL